MTVDGVRTPVVAGETYTGTIVLTPAASAASVDTGDNSGIWIMISALALLSVAAVAYVRRNSITA
jgi:LPXTG-motif cell wall-anchored protein